MKNLEKQSHTELEARLAELRAIIKHRGTHSTVWERARAEEIVMELDRRKARLG